MASTALAVTGCSDSTKQGLATCKVKAIEAYKPENVEFDNRSADYVYYCMRAAGYHRRVDATCQGRIGNMMDFCWQPGWW